MTAAGAIDLHAHFVPPRFLAGLEDLGIKVTEGEGEYRLVVGDEPLRRPLRASLTDIHEREEWMRVAGIARQVLAPWPPLADLANEAGTGSELALAFNEAMAGATLGNDGFFGLGLVPLTNPVVAAEVLGEAVSRLGLGGALIPSRASATLDLDDSSLDPFWCRAQELACVLLLHPAEPLGAEALRRQRLDNILGVPSETTVALARLVLGGVMERFPDLRIVAVHGGGFAALAVGRLDHAIRSGSTEAPALGDLPSAYFGRFFYDTLTHSPESLRMLATRFGGERILLGSDFPFTMGDRDPASTVRATVGSDGDLADAILRGNAERLLRRPLRLEVD